MNYILVFLGGGIGSILRYGLSQGLKRFDFDFPIATLFANGLSCVLLGFTLGLFSNQNISEPQKLLLITGVCGGFSTFSTFTNETFLLAQNGNLFLAILNIFVNLLLCFVCLLVGMKLS